VRAGSPGPGGIRWLSVRWRLAMASASPWSAAHFQHFAACSVIYRPSFTGGVHQPEVELCITVSLLCSERVPSDGLDVVLVNTSAVGVHKTHHRTASTSCCSAPIPSM
jgi:hypothetical protein